MIRTLKADESALKTLVLQVSKLAAKKGNSDSEKKLIQSWGLKCRYLGCNEVAIGNLVC